LIAYTGQ